MKILCVDDDPVARVIYTKGLGKALPNDEIMEADSGESASRILEERYFDVVITDLSMPGLSGIDVLRIAKEENICTEVIVLTGKASVTSAVEAMRSGARDYIEKPINIPLLCEKIENIRDYYRRGREAEDLRTAKEAYEEQACHDIHLLELRLHRIESIISGALEVLRRKNGASESERLAQVAEILESMS
ncbi:MAG: response regulator [Candidatus Eisenbacteria sp.]|nr:response regulator [Candidatus Eisenbacteria bacterium]